MTPTPSDFAACEGCDVVGCNESQFLSCDKRLCGGDIEVIESEISNFETKTPRFFLIETGEGPRSQYQTKACLATLMSAISAFHQIATDFRNSGLKKRLVTIFEDGTSAILVIGRPRRLQHRQRRLQVRQIPRHSFLQAPDLNYDNFEV